MDISFSQAESSAAEAFDALNDVIRSIAIDPETKINPKLLAQLQQCNEHWMFTVHRNSMNTMRKLKHQLEMTEMSFRSAVSDAHELRSRPLSANTSGRPHFPTNCFRSSVPKIFRSKYTDEQQRSTVSEDTAASITQSKLSSSEQKNVSREGAAVAAASVKKQQNSYEITSSTNATINQQSTLQQATISPRTLKKQAYVPFENDVLDSTSTFLHQLVKTLQFGRGTTVLTITSVTRHARSGMLNEGPDEDTHKLALQLMSILPRGVFVKEQMEPQGEWSVFAKQRHRERQLRTNPILARRRQDLIAEPLSFLLDRPQGLLQFISENAPPVSGEDFSLLSSASSGEKINLVHKSEGKTLRYINIPGTRESAAWVQVDLRPWIVSLSAFAMASSHPMHSGAPPRSWTVEGSADGGKSWIVLSRHRNDRSICGGTDFAVWRLSTLIDAPSFDDEVNKVDAETSNQKSKLFSPPCSLIRITNDGANAMGGYDLQVSGIELYGRVLCCSTVSFDQVPSVYFGNSQMSRRVVRPSKIHEFAPMPPEPLPPKKGKKKNK